MLRIYRIKLLNGSVDDKNVITTVRSYKIASEEASKPNKVYLLFYDMLVE